MLGKTLRKIRENRNMTQQELTKGIIRQATYSRIERGQLTISADLLYKLVERLNISMNEFFYIHQGYQATPKQQLIQNFVRLELVLSKDIEEQLVAVHQYLNMHHDEDVLMLHYAYCSLKALVCNQNMEEVRAFATHVWQRMQKLDHWYLYDLELLNTIILYFPLDVAREITYTAIQRLDAYNSYERDTTLLKLYFRLNLTSLYLEENAFEQCLAELDSIHRQSYKHLTYQLLAFLLVRKMTCKHFLQQDYTKEKEEFAMLQQLFHNEDVFNLLKNEMTVNKVDYI